MSFRYDMKDKTPQQQAIVRQRDKADKLRKESKKETKFKCSPAPRLGDYESVVFTAGNKTVLELRVSGTAIVNGPCNLGDVNIHEWLCETGTRFVSEIDDYKILIITSADVVDKKLVTGWKNLKQGNKE